MAGFVGFDNMSSIDSDAGVSEADDISEVMVNCVQVAKEKQTEAHSNVRAARLSIEDLVVDYEKTNDILAAAKKHRKNIEMVWKHRRLMTDAICTHQDAFCDVQDSTDDYVKKAGG